MNLIEYKMELLPDKVTCYIFSFLDVVSLIKCRRVCKDWSILLLRNANIWKNFYNESEKELQELKCITCYDKLVALHCAWNPNDCSENITVNNFIMQRNTQAQSSDAIRGKSGFSRGRHYWTVSWDGPSYGSAAVVGVATKSAPLHGQGYFALLGSDEQSWGWNIPGQVTAHNGMVNTYPINKQELKLKDTIGVILDMINLTLSFEVNNCFLGIAFDNLPKVPLYPAISVVYGGSKVKLLYYGTPLDG